MPATTPTASDLAAIPPFPVRRLAVAEYLQMIAAGILAEAEDFELLEGWMAPKMTRNPPHDVAILLADGVLRGLLPPGWHTRTQMGSTTADSAPEPDLAVVRGAARDYLARHPGPQDIGLVVEVAESSLARDRGIKARLYARAGIPIYWIVNLVAGRVEVLSDPTGPGPEPQYRGRVEFGPGDAVPLVLDGREVGRVAAADLLP